LNGLGTHLLAAAGQRERSAAATAD